MIQAEIDWNQQLIMNEWIFIADTSSILTLVCTEHKVSFSIERNVYCLLSQKEMAALAVFKPYPQNKIYTYIKRLDGNM